MPISDNPTLLPRFVHDSGRATLIEKAIDGYLGAGREIPTSWIHEYVQIIESHGLEPKYRIVLQPKSIPHHVNQKP